MAQDGTDLPRAGKYKKSTLDGFIVPDSDSDNNYDDDEDRKLKKSLAKKREAGPLFEVSFHRVILDEVSSILFDDVHRTLLKHALTRPTTSKIDLLKRPKPVALFLQSTGGGMLCLISLLWKDQ